MLQSCLDRHLPVGMAQYKHMTLMLWCPLELCQSCGSTWHPCISSLPCLQDTNGVGCWGAAATGRGERRAQMTATGSTCQPSTPTRPSSRSQLAMPRQQRHDTQQVQPGYNALPCASAGAWLISKHLMGIAMHCSLSGWSTIG